MSLAARTRPAAEARVGSTLSTRPPCGVPLRRPAHPGRLLDRLVLAPLAINQSAAARLLGISRRRVNELVLGQRAMSADTAIRCALAFGVDAGFWLAQQARWDSWQHWQAICRAQRRAAAPQTGSAPPVAARPPQVAPAAGLPARASRPLPVGA